MRTRVRLAIQIPLEGKIRTELWENEREKLMEQLAEEMLPKLKEQAPKKVNTELCKKLAAEVRVQVRTELRAENRHQLIGMTLHLTAPSRWLLIQGIFIYSSHHHYSTIFSLFITG